jgi:hypothetical protein
VLILASAAAAPFLSVYLSMARPLPVTARDILAQVELASGLGLIRDTVTIANDPQASLSQKVALFGASAVMSSEDRKRLDGLLDAVGRSQLTPPVSLQVLPTPEVVKQNGYATPLAARS